MHEERAVEDQQERGASLDDVLSFLVHELRNPLAVVKGFAATLEESAAAMNPDAVQRSAAAIRRSADNLASLLDSLSDVRSLVGDQIDLQRSDLLISELIEETARELDPLTFNHLVSIQIEDDVLVRVDRVRIRQVLTNVIANAVKFSPPDSPVDIAVRRAGDTVEVCVSDHGPGIPTHRLDELFHKYARLGSGIGGTGIGLFLSRGIARAHGGELLLGDSSDKGCTFILRLPIHLPNGPAGSGETADHRPR